MLRFLLIAIAILTIIVLIGAFLTCQVFSSGHRIHADKLYWRGGWPIRDNFVSTIDRRSIKLLTDNFAKDKQKVFYQSWQIDKADAATFELLGGGFAKDQYHAFHHSSLIQEADIATFTTKTFTDPKGTKQVYGIDKKHVYYHPFVVSDDPKNFVILGGGYSKDAQHVYFEQFKIAEADLTTFHIKVLNDRYGNPLIFGIDSKHAYQNTRIVSDKPQTFNGVVE